MTAWGDCRENSFAAVLVYRENYATLIPSLEALLKSKQRFGKYLFFITGQRTLGQQLERDGFFNC